MVWLCACSGGIFGWICQPSFSPSIKWVLMLGVLLINCFSGCCVAWGLTQAQGLEHERGPTEVGWHFMVGKGRSFPTPFRVRGPLPDGGLRVPGPPWVSAVHTCIHAWVCYFAFKLGPPWSLKAMPPFTLGLNPAVLFMVPDCLMSLASGYEYLHHKVCKCNHNNTVLGNLHSLSSQVP